MKKRWCFILAISGIVFPTGEFRSWRVRHLLINTSLQTYGAKATQIKAEIGSAVFESELIAALKQKKYKLVTVTHVDTSTGVLSDIKALAKAVRDTSSDTLVSMGSCVKMKIDKM